MYCDAKTLKQLIVQAKRRKEVGPELALMVRRIGENVQRMYRWLDQEDVANETVLRFLRCYQKIKSNKKPSCIFSYVTAIATSVCKQMIRSNTSQHRRMVGYAERHEIPKRK